MGVYGTFVEAFSELFETVEIQEYGATEWKRVRALFMPIGGDDIVRRKFSSANWVADLGTDDALYFKRRNASFAKQGNRVKLRGEYYSIMKVKDFDKSGSFIRCVLERQQGAVPEQGQKLVVKEPKFI